MLLVSPARFYIDLFVCVFAVFRRGYVSALSLHLVGLRDETRVVRHDSQTVSNLFFPPIKL